MPLRAIAKSLVSSGKLAVAARPTEVSMRVASGQACDLCGSTIAAPEPEYQPRIEERPNLRFHAACYSAWLEALGSPGE